MLMAKLPKSVLERGATWIYVGNKERRELLKKLLEYTKAGSVSEAIFIAVANYLKQEEQQGKQARKKFSSLEGLWQGKSNLSWEEIHAAELRGREI